MILSFRRFQGTLLLPLVSLGSIGCSPLSYLEVAFSNPAPTPIENLSQQNQNTTVYVRGTVGDRAPFLGTGAYQLQDETGKVWVLTDDILPQTGEEVTIKGQLEYQSIPVRQYELGELYLLELQKFPQQAAPSDLPSTQSSDDFLLPHK